VSALALAAAAALLASAALWELAGSRGEEAGRAVRRLAARLSGGRIRSLGDAGFRLGIGERITRAGLERSLSVPAVLLAKGGGVATGAALAVVVAPAAPARLGLIVTLLLPVAGFLAPDAMLERAARLRRGRLVAALPDALDLLAVAVGAGRSPPAAFRDIAAGAAGPLASELGAAVAEIECGAPPAAAVDRLRQRVPGGEVGALVAALERSRRYGSPLAVQLQEQSAALRREARRRVEERAARAAPKIQLVVALVLVPSVLLLILAALLAYSETLFTL
jgi:tight adherence protein C